MKRMSIVICLSLLPLSLIGCDSDEQDCLNICRAAQDQSCTSINDCSDFCSSTAALKDKANCESEYDAYHDCANSTPTCSIDAQCASQENAFAACVVPYCYANPNDADCIKLENS
jgi:hypothetical protein